MANLKWADVAHYYQESNIKFEDHSEEGGGEVSEFNFLSALCAKRYAQTPILRALEDMTEGEAKQLCDVVGEIWRKDFEFGYESGLEYLHKKEVADNWRNIDYFMGEPVAWSWLISKGFDVFGLIESGQAIRKGVENGL